MCLITVSCQCRVGDHNKFRNYAQYNKTIKVLDTFETLTFEIVVALAVNKLSYMVIYQRYSQYLWFMKTNDVFQKLSQGEP